MLSAAASIAVLLAAVALGYAASVFMSRAASLQPLWTMVIAVAVVVLAALALVILATVVTRMAGS